jgi:hypothetical protein
VSLDYATWAEALREGTLFGLACSCGHTNGSPTGACPHCGSRDLERVELPTEGTVHTETTIQVPPAGFEERGYQVGVIELGASKVTVRFAGSGIEIGDEVRLAGVFDEDDGHPAPLFEPV